METFDELADTDIATPDSSDTLELRLGGVVGNRLLTSTCRLVTLCANNAWLALDTLILCVNDAWLALEALTSTCRLVTLCAKAFMHWTSASSTNTKYRHITSFEQYHRQCPQ